MNYLVTENKNKSIIYNDTTHNYEIRLKGHFLPITVNQKGDVSFDVRAINTIKKDEWTTLNSAAMYCQRLQAEKVKIQDYKPIKPLDTSMVKRGGIYLTNKNTAIFWLDKATYTSFDGTIGNHISCPYVYIEVPFNTYDGISVNPDLSIGINYKDEGYDNYDDDDESYYLELNSTIEIPNDLVKQIGTFPPEASIFYGNMTGLRDKKKITLESSDNVITENQFKTIREPEEMEY